MSSDSCVLCGSTQHEPLPRGPEALSYVTCTQCGFVWLANARAPESVLEDESQNAYYLAQQSGVDAEMAARKAWAQGVIQRARNPVHTVADIGCSNGLMLKTFARDGYEVVGLEQCTTTAFYGIEMLQLPILIGDLMTVRPRRKYDLVWLAHVLEHLPQPLESLRIIKTAWCRAGGMLYIQVPSIDLFLEDEALRPISAVFCDAHVTLFRASTLEAMLRAAGFSDFEVVRQNTELEGEPYSVLDAFAYVPPDADEPAVAAQ